MFGERLRHVQAVLIPLVVLATAGLLAEYVVRLDAERQAEIQRNQVMAQASALRAQLEGEVNSTLYLANGLGGYVSAYGVQDEASVNVVLATVFQYDRHLRNIALAPDNVIRYVYPMKGNEKAVGLDYTQVPAQWPAVKRAIDTHSTVVAGPVELVQGGHGLISRTPVYRPDGQYWGIISLIMKTDSLFSTLDRDAHQMGLSWALRGKDGQGARGDTIHGDASLFAHDSVQQVIRVPGGTWVLAARPQQGWAAGSGRTSMLQLSGWGLALLIASLTYFIISERNHIRHLATHDPLTNLPNRRLLSDRLDRAIAKAQRDGQGFSILCLDLNQFKPINDTHGHHIGDQVLCTVAARLQKCLRSIDTVARIGGDEFLLVLPEVESDLDVLEVVNRVAAAVKEPIRINELLLHTSASIGICHYPLDGQTQDDLMRITDQAMYSAKRESRSSVYRVGEQASA
jgi:diguanylate cyclase (GGDEF)-like protein